MTLEICVDSVESALNAEKGGADRIELCSALSVGGLTPTPGLLREVKKRVKLPIFVMLRPRSGNFIYSKSEMAVVLQDMEILKKEGADGFVFGALTSDNIVDNEFCKKVVSGVKPLPLTFHRAFDLVCEWKSALQQIADLGFDRILTSGQADNVIEGKEKLHEIVQESKKTKVIVMIGSGVNETNLKEIIHYTRASEYHSSASVPKPVQARSLHPSMGTSEPLEQKVTSTEKVSAMKNIMNS